MLQKQVACHQSNLSVACLGLLRGKQELTPGELCIFSLHVTFIRGLVNVLNSQRNRFCSRIVFLTEGVACSLMNAFPSVSLLFL